MKGGYTVSIRGEIPPDLKRRISALHAAAIRQTAKLRHAADRHLNTEVRPLRQDSGASYVEGSCD